MLLNTYNNCSFFRIYVDLSTKMSKCFLIEFNIQTCWGRIFFHLYYDILITSSLNYICIWVTKVLSRIYWNCILQIFVLLFASHSIKKNDVLWCICDKLKIFLRKIWKESMGDVPFYSWLSPNTTNVFYYKIQIIE